MRTRTALVVSLAGVVAAGSLAPALAAPPKKKPAPIKQTWTATAPVPDPSPFAGQSGICETVLPMSAHEHAFTVPAAGTLVTELTGITGDWSMGVFDASGASLGTSDQTDPVAAINGPEKITLKFKKKTSVIVRSCNFAGGPTANGALTFTYK